MNKTSKIILGIVVVIIIIGLIFVFGKEKRTEKEVIKIGAILPLSGSAASAGEGVLNGIKLAINESYYSKNILLVVEDSKNDPTEGLKAFNKLIELDKIDFLIGQVSSIGLALKDKVNEKKIPTMWIASHPDLLKDNSFMFRSLPVSEDYIIRLIEIMEKERIDKIGVMYINDDYGASLRNSLSSNFKGIITTEQAYDKTGRDFRTEVTKLLATKPEGVFVAGYGSATGIVIKQLREMGFEGPVFAPPEIVQQEVINNAGEAINDTIFVSLSLPQDFKNKCLEKLGKEPDPGYLLGYVSASVILKSLEKAELNKNRAKDYLYNLKDMEIDSVGTILILDKEIKYPLEIKKFIENIPVEYYNNNSNKTN